VLNGTRTTLYQSGLAEKWWPYASRHFCLSDNIYRKAWKNRFGKSFEGPKIPFGALIDFKPSPTRDKPVGKFQARSVPGVFLGYHLGAGGKWKGDFYVAALSDFQKSIGNKKHVPVQRVKEVVADYDGVWSFPIKAYNDAERRTIKGTVSNNSDETHGDAKEDEQEKRDVPRDVSELPDAPPPLGPNTSSSSRASPREVFEKEGPANASDVRTFLDDIVTVLPDGNTIIADCYARKRKGSDRPLDIIPEVWNKMNKAEKTEALAKEKDSLAQKLAKQPKAFMDFEANAIQVSH
jgi:hypothetical protein